MVKEQVMADFLNFHSPDKQEWIIAYCIEAIWIIIINILTIVNFYVNRRIFGRSVILLVNLSVADLLFGLCFLSQGIYNQIYPKEDTIKYYAGNTALEAMVYFCCCSSGFCLGLIAIERVIVTFAPFRHRTSGLKPYAVSIAINWTVSLTVGLAHYFIPDESIHYLLYVYVSGILSALILIIISYTAIFIKVRSQNQIHDRVATQTSQQRERSMAYTLMMVTFCSLSAWLPISVLFALYEIASIQVPVLISGLSFMVLASNSFINTVLYTLRIDDFRKALFQLVCKCSRYRRQRVMQNNLVLRPTRPALQQPSTQHGVANSSALK